MKKRDLIQQWDALEERIRTLQWAKNTFLVHEITAQIPTLRLNCAWETTTEEDKQTWMLIEQRVSVRDAFEILSRLHGAGVTVGKFLSEVRANGGYLDRALACLTQPTGNRAGVVLPIEWRN